MDSRWRQGAFQNNITPTLILPPQGGGNYEDSAIF
jgi:hypothetical protein